MKTDVALGDEEVKDRRTSTRVGGHDIVDAFTQKLEGTPVYSFLVSRKDDKVSFWIQLTNCHPQNSLPLCRVEKLVSAIAASCGMPDFDLTWPDPENVRFYRHEMHARKVFFWMDTLCVPREPEDIRARASKFHLFSS